MSVYEMIAWYGVFVVSTTVHEFAHAFVAKRGGDLTAYLGGQVSLDPIPHIRREPLGMIVFPVISLLVFKWPFGYASAPYDPYWAMSYPRRAARMAVAGPASNFLIVLICMVLGRLGVALDFFSMPPLVREILDPIVVANGGGIDKGLAYLISIFFTMNLILTVLNLIPLPPLDGSQILLFFLSDERAHRYQQILWHPTFGIVGLVLAWQVFDPLFRVVKLGVVALMYLGHG